MSNRGLILTSYRTKNVMQNSSSKSSCHGSHLNLLATEGGEGVGRGHTGMTKLLAAIVRPLIYTFQICDVPNSLSKNTLRKSWGTATPGTTESHF